MSEFMPTNKSNVEASAELLASKFGLPDIGPGVRVELQDLDMQYGMRFLVMSFRTAEEQTQAITQDGIGTYGPDIEVRTFDDRRSMALYRYDRATGLTVVNSFNFDPAETRPITRDEYESLEHSSNKAPIANARVCNRVLTVQGQDRFARELKQVHDQFSN